MEIQPPPIQMPPSPTLSNTAVVSPDTLSHHSSPAKTSRICYQAPPPHHLQHQVIDETMSSKIPLSISTHHQLASGAIGTPLDHPHSSISGISGMHSDVNAPEIVHRSLKKKKPNSFHLNLQFALDRQQVCQSSATTQTSPTAGHHLALLYHSSHHHHHHHSLHPQLPAVRRPSRLPPAVYTRPPEIKALVAFSHFIAFLLNNIVHSCNYIQLHHSCHRIFYISLLHQISNVCNDTVSFIWEIVGCNGNSISNGRGYIYLHSTFIL